MLLAAALVLELARESLTGSHCRYREVIDGIPTENYVTRVCRERDRTPNAMLRDGAIALRAEGLRWVDGRVARRSIVVDRLLEPYAHDYDAETGALLRRTPLFFRAKPGRVFDPNPVVTMNDPTLQDHGDSASAVPPEAYVDVELPDEALSGPYVTLVDRQARNVAPPAGDSLVFDREDDGFEDVSAYFHIDRNQRHLQSLGYTGPRAVAPYAVEVDAHAANGADDSYFIPSTTEAGKGTLYFGEGGTDDAEDADLLVHEYGHAVIEWIAPGTFGGAFAGEPRALGEGITDYWAFSAHVEARRASGRDPYCFADWDARCWEAPSERCGYDEGSDCLRRLDSTKTMADYERNESSGVEHRNGAIWASALREIREQIGRTASDKIVIESLFGTPPRPTFAVMAERMLQADRLLHQGAHTSLICSAMNARGIAVACDTAPRGELTSYRGNEYDVPIPENSPAGVRSTITVTDPRTIERLFVRADIQHPSRGDLRVTLTAPDGTLILLHEISSSRTQDIHVTWGLTALPAESLDFLRGRSAAGDWTLHVADRRPLDVGVLQSWGLEIQFAGDEPLVARPRGTDAQVIPVVTHVFGQDRAYRSDVRIANPQDTAREATLVFTRSGEDGLAKFAALQLALAPGQTIAFDDVVERAFRTFGSGTLEVLGDVLVMSRTDGQQVPPAASTTAFGEPPLLVAPMPRFPARFNFGLAETGGGRGVVRAGDREWPIAPFSHVQFPVGPDLLEVRVVEGNARVAAYISQIATDAMFIPAERTPERTRIAPAITVGPPEAPLWRSDAWFASVHPQDVTVDAIPGGSVTVMSPDAFDDVLAELFQLHGVFAALRAGLRPGGFGATRIVSGERTQFVPFLSEHAGEQHLLFVEHSDRARTNVGIVSGGPAAAEVVIYDAAGAELERHQLATAGGVVQVPVAATLTVGRALVRFTEGTGRAYASRIDAASGDAMFVAGQVLTTGDR